MRQLTDPLDVAKNMFLTPILEKNIRFTKTPYQRLFAVADEKLHDMGVDSGGEHSHWDGYDLVSNEELEQVYNSLPVAIPPIPPVVNTYKNDVR